MGENIGEGREGRGRQGEMEGPSPHPLNITVMYV